MPRPTRPAIRRAAVVAATTLAATTLLTGESIGQSLPSAPPVDAPKVAKPKVEAPKAAAPKVEKPDSPAPRAPAPKAEAPKAPAPKVEPKAPAPKAPAPKVEAPKAPAPKPDPPKGAPKAPAPRVETPKAPAPKPDPPRGAPKAPSTPKNPVRETPRAPKPPRVEAPSGGRTPSPKAPARPRTPVEPRSSAPDVRTDGEAPARARTPSRPNRSEDGAARRIETPRAPGSETDGGGAQRRAGESTDAAAGAVGGATGASSATGAGARAGATAAAATGGALLEVLGVSASGGENAGAEGLRSRIERSDRFRRTSSQRELARVLERSGNCVPRLTTIRRRVVLLRVGVDGQRPLSRRQVARRLGIPVARLIREERGAVRTLRTGGACATGAGAATETGTVVAPTGIADVDASSAARGFGALLAGDPGGADSAAVTGEVAGARMSGTRDAEADATARRGDVVETPLGAFDPTSGIGLALGSLLLVLAVLTALLFAREVRRQWRVW